ncbi:hypothetical protein [Desulfobacter postgatei]|uniref:hypothetical protein n=1 Tax=Desulfobacter postgatei TaxID=2293 RepID=UPI002FDB91C9
MHEFNPKNMPEVTIFFEFFPGQPQTFHQPGYDDEIEIHHLKINGDTVSIDLESFLIEQFGDLWAMEILKQRRAA